jgi:hypothetical protein
LAAVFVVFHITEQETGLNGGGGSPLQTALWPEFPATGKSTWKIVIWNESADKKPQYPSAFLRILSKNSPNKTGKI